MCSIWLPVDPVSKQTCLRLVKGSHAWTDNFKPVHFDGPPFSSYQVKVGHEEEVVKHFLPTPDFDEIKDCQVLSWDMKVIFNFQSVASLILNYLLPRETRTFGIKPDDKGKNEREKV